MSSMTSTILLWLFVMNLGIAFGAGLYEHRIVVSRWLVSDTGARPGWNADAARQDDTGRRFWALTTTVSLTLLTLVNLFAAWRSPEAVRGWWLAASVAALAERAVTFSYFIPTMVWLMAASEPPDSAAIATRWSNLNYVRHAIVLAAWVASMKAFALWHQLRV